MKEKRIRLDDDTDDVERLHAVIKNKTEFHDGVAAHLDRLNDCAGTTSSTNKGWLNDKALKSFASVITETKDEATRIENERDRARSEIENRDPRAVRAEKIETNAFYSLGFSK